MLPIPGDGFLWLHPPWAVSVAKQTARTHITLSDLSAEITMKWPTASMSLARMFTFLSPACLLPSYGGDRGHILSSPLRSWLVRASCLHLCAAAWCIMSSPLCNGPGGEGVSPRSTQDSILVSTKVKPRCTTSQCQGEAKIHNWLAQR